MNAFRAPWLLIAMATLVPAEARGSAASSLHSASLVQSRQIETCATEVVARVRSDSLGRPWARSMSSSGCDVFHGQGGRLAMEDYWVFRCSSAFCSGRFEEYGYLVGDRPTPTLERMQWLIGRSSGLDGPAMDSLWQRILVQVRRQLGPPRPVSAPQGFGSAWWTDVLCVDRPHGLVRLYRVRPMTWPAKSEPDSIVVEHLGGAIRDQVTGMSWNDDEGQALFGFEGDGDSLMIRELKRTTVALKSSHPELSAAMTAQPESSKNLLHFRHAIRVAAPGSPDQHLLMYAAHLGLHFLPEAAWADTAVGEALRRAFPGAEGHPCNEDSLVFQLAAAVGADQWTDAAFLELMNRGWGPPCFACDGPEEAGGTDISRPVIEHGEAFIRRFPGSPIFKEIEWRVAMAHETAWALAKAGGVRSPETETHRSAAVRLYQSLVQTEASSARGRAAKLRMQRMKLDVDTGFRRYWCFED